MTNININIVNYLGNEAEDKVRFDKRKSALVKQLEYFKDKPNINVVVWDQCNCTDLHTQYDWVKWLDTPRGNLCVSRNRILKDFYASDDDWMVMTDNDLSIYDYSHEQHLDGEIIFEKLPGLLQQITGKIASFHINNPRSTDVCQSRYKVDGKWDPLLIDNWVFANCIKYGGMIFTSNTRKHFGKEYYNWDDLESHEDWEWRSQMAVDGLVTARLCNLFLKEFSSGDYSTIFKQELVEVKDDEDTPFDALFAVEKQAPEKKPKFKKMDNHRTQSYLNSDLRIGKYYSEKYGSEFLTTKAPYKMNYNHVRSLMAASSVWNYENKKYGKVLLIPKE